MRPMFQFLGSVEPAVISRQSPDFVGRISVTANPPTDYGLIFSHSQRATASEEDAPSPCVARRFAARIVAISILPSSGVIEARNVESLARFGASSTIASYGGMACLGSSSTTRSYLAIRPSLV